jgi:hypothetical protein
LVRDPWCLPRFGSPGSLTATEEASNSIFQRLLEADHNHICNIITSMSFLVRSSDASYIQISVSQWLPLDLILYSVEVWMMVLAS